MWWYIPSFSATRILYCLFVKINIFDRVEVMNKGNGIWSYCNPTFYYCYFLNVANFNNSHLVIVIHASLINSLVKCAIFHNSSFNLINRTCPSLHIIKIQNLIKQKLYTFLIQICLGCSCSYFSCQCTPWRNTRSFAVNIDSNYKVKST